MTARLWLRLFRNIWRQSPRMAMRVLVRHVVIQLRGDGLIKIPTPLQEASIRTAPNGDTLQVEQCYRSTETGPLIVKYRRTTR